LSLGKRKTGGRLAPAKHGKIRKLTLVKEMNAKSFLLKKPRSRGGEKKVRFAGKKKVTHAAEDEKPLVSHYICD